MTIDFTRDQFENLLKLVYLGGWMINGVRTEDERVKKFHDIEQYLYSFAKDQDLESFVAYDTARKSYIPTLETGSDVEAYKEEYDSEVFWDELIQRLSMRDFLRLYGERTEKMGMQEQSRNRHQIIEKYIREFEEYGVDTIAVKGVDAT